MGCGCSNFPSEKEDIKAKKVPHFDIPHMKVDINEKKDEHVEISPAAINEDIDNRSNNQTGNMIRKISKSSISNSSNLTKSSFNSKIRENIIKIKTRDKNNDDVNEKDECPNSNREIKEEKREILQLNLKKINEVNYKRNIEKYEIISNCINFSINQSLMPDTMKSNIKFTIVGANHLNNSLNEDENTKIKNIYLEYLKYYLEIFKDLDNIDILMSMPIVPDKNYNNYVIVSKSYFNKLIKLFESQGNFYNELYLIDSYDKLTKVDNININNEKDHYYPNIIIFDFISIY